MKQSMVLRGAVSGALLMAAGPSFAIDPATVPAGNVLYVGGATATDNAIRAAFLQDGPNSICDGGGNANNITVINSTTGAARGFIIACTSRASVTGGTSQPIAVVKETLFGSRSGTENVGLGLAVDFLDPALTTGSNLVTSTPTGQQIRRTADGVANVTPVAVNRAAQVGVSDVESALFGVNEATSNITQQKGVQILFAPAVSQGLYRALQLSQGLATDDTTANMPSLSTAQFRALLTGRIVNWNRFKSGISGVNLPTLSVTYGSGNVGTPLSNSVFICRRGDSSGTQKTMEVTILKEGCVADVPTVLTANGAAGGCESNGCPWSNTLYSAASTTVFAGDGTGDVLSCLHFRDEQRRWAVGFASVENNWSTAQSSSTRRFWRFTKLDGVVPSVSNAASGEYPYIAQSVLYTITDTGLTTHEATGVAKQVEDYLVANVGTEPFIENVNRSFRFTVGPVFDGGQLVIPGLGADVAPIGPSLIDEASIRTTPISSVVKQTPSGVTNNCIDAYGRTGGPIAGTPAG